MSREASLLACVRPLRICANTAYVWVVGLEDQKSSPFTKGHKATQLHFAWRKRLEWVHQDAVRPLWSTSAVCAATHSLLRRRMQSLFLSFTLAACDQDADTGCSLLLPFLSSAGASTGAVLTRYCAVLPQG